MNSKKSSDQIFDFSFPSTEIEVFDTNITLSDALDQPLTTLLKTKASALNEIILDDDDDEIAKTIEGSTYSRLPVYDGDIDNIIGILNTKQLIKLHLNGDAINIKKILIIKFIC